jgi:hypothetical protein
MNNDTTRWRLTGIEGFSAGLELTLVVDTTAQTVLEAIEAAATSNGIELERIEDVGDQAELEDPSPPPIAPGSVSNLVVTGLADDRHR